MEKSPQRDKELGIRRVNIQDPLPSSSLEQGMLDCRSQTVRYAALGSILLHLSFLLMAVVEYMSPPPLKKTIKVPTKVWVRTVKLNEPSFQPSGIAEPTKNIAIAPIEQADPVADQQPQQQEPKRKEEKSAEEHKTREVQQKMESAPSAPKKPREKKAPPPSKKSAKKSPRQETPKKEKSAPPSNKKPNTAKKEEKKQTQPQQKKSSPTSEYDESLLADALTNLDSSSRHVSGNSRGTVKSTPNKQVKMVGDLNAEQGNFQCAEGREEYTSATPEGWYVSDLIRRLQLNVRLLEPGSVKVSLTLSRNGKLIECSITQSANQAAKAHLQKALSGLKFAPFGQAFPQESQHTFKLKLEDSGAWSM